MPKITVNLDEIGDAFELMEPCKALAKLTDCNEEDSQAGKPMLVWDWEILEGENAGKTIKSFTSLQENALFGFKEHAQAFGYDGDCEVDTDNCVGKRALITIGIQRRKLKKGPRAGEEADFNAVTKVEAAPKGSSSKATSSKSLGTKKGNSKDDIPF